MEKGLKFIFLTVPTSSQKFKTIEGYSWHAEGKYWSISCSKFERLLSIFDGEKLDIDSSVWLDKLEKEMVVRKYSLKTIKAYVHYNDNFLKFSGKNPDEMSNTDVKDFLFQMVEEKDVSTSTLNIAINALKFYYGEVLKREFVYEMKRPRKDKKLPVVLSQEEVYRIISSVDNIKHKAILMLVYSSGLRVSEVVKLMVENIDVERKLIHIKGAKGRKDRYTMLSDVAVDALREYQEKYKPEKWMFMGMKPGKHISTRTV